MIASARVLLRLVELDVHRLPPGARHLIRSPMTRLPWELSGSPWKSIHSSLVKRQEVAALQLRLALLPARQLETAELQYLIRPAPRSAAERSAPEVGHRSGGGGVAAVCASAAAGDEGTGEA